MSYQPKNWRWCKHYQRDTAKRYGQERAYTVLPSRDWKEYEMRDTPDDGKGLERLGRIIVTLCVIGVAASAVAVGWAVYALWKGLT